MKKPMQAAKKKTAAVLLAIVSSVALAGAVEASLPRFDPNPATTSIDATLRELARVERLSAVATTPPTFDPRFSLAAPRRLGRYGQLFDVEKRERAPVRLDLPAWAILKTRIGVLDFSLFGKAPENQRFSCVFAVGLCYGAWTDPVTGLAYHRARWYDARTASWLSEDPLLDVDSVNLYAFVGWGPQSGTDPTGLVTVRMGGEFLPPQTLSPEQEAHLEAGSEARRDLKFLLKWSVLRSNIGDRSYQNDVLGAAIGAVWHPVAVVLAAPGSELMIANPLGMAAFADDAVRLVGIADDVVDDAARLAGAADDLVRGRGTMPAGEASAVVKDLRRPYIRKPVRGAVDAAAPRTAEGKAIDPNTFQPIEGKPDLGHKYGREFRREKVKAKTEGLMQKEFNDRMNDPDLYQLEDPVPNRGHQYEKPGKN